jgi:hypothetical protein
MEVPMKIRLALPFMALLVSLLALCGVETYDERHGDEIPPGYSADEIFELIMNGCKYMMAVGTAGGSETIEEFDE